MFVLKWNILIYGKIVFTHEHLKRTSVYKVVHRYTTARTVEGAAWFGPSWLFYSQNKGGLHSCWSDTDTEGICGSALCPLQPSSPSVSSAPGRENEFVWHWHPLWPPCKAEFFSRSALGKAVHCLPLKVQLYFFFFFYPKFSNFLCVLALSLLATRATQARPVAFLRGFSFISISMAWTALIL